MSAPVPSGKYVEGMRLTERERSLLIEQMKKSGVSDRRKSPRAIVEGSFSVLLTMESPGGSATHFKIYPWDLAKGGVGFFHRSFVYPGTKCTFTGLTFAGQPFTVKGEVARCSHVSGNVHAVGTKLESEIDPDALLGANCGDGANLGVPRVEDWWTRLGSLSADLAKLAREKAAPETIRKHIGAIAQHASTQPDVPSKSPTTEADAAPSKAAA